MNKGRGRSEDFNYIIPECDPEHFSELSGIICPKMMVKILYYMQMLFTIISFIIVEKGENLTSGKLCEERDALKRWLETSIAYKVKASQKSIKEYSDKKVT